MQEKIKQYTDQLLKAGFTQEQIQAMIKIMEELVKQNINEKTASQRFQDELGMPKIQAAILVKALVKQVKKIKKS